MNKILTTLFGFCLFVPYSQGQIDQKHEPSIQGDEARRLEAIAMVSMEIRHIEKELLAAREKHAKLNAEFDDPKEWVDAYTPAIESGKRKIAELNLSTFFAKSNDQREQIQADIKQWTAAVKWMVETRRYYWGLELQSDYIKNTEHTLVLMRKNLRKSLTYDEIMKEYDEIERFEKVGADSNGTLPASSDTSRDGSSSAADSVNVDLLEGIKKIDVDEKRDDIGPAVNAEPPAPKL